MDALVACVSRKSSLCLFGPMSLWAYVSRRGLPRHLSTFPGFALIFARSLGVLQARCRGLALVTALLAKNRMRAGEPQHNAEGTCLPAMGYQCASLHAPLPMRLSPCAITNLRRAHRERKRETVWGTSGGELLHQVKDGE